MTRFRLVKRLYYFQPIHRLLFPFVQAGRVVICRLRYKLVLARLRAKVRRGEKLRVLFLADDPSKWKYQPVYNEMKESSLFVPIVAIGLRQNHDYELSDQELKLRRTLAIDFYERLGCQCVWACDLEKRTLIDLHELGADIVFYQEPWMILGRHQIIEVAKHALTMYVPYSVEWECSPILHWLCTFHRLLYINFVWSRSQAEQEAPHGLFRLSGSFFEVGHTSFDRYAQNTGGARGDYVIYAPHFAFPYKESRNVETLGTFEWNGREMLAYAQKHPEVKWAWKPHPALRWQLEAKGFMTHEEVDAYFAAWEKIGVACYDGDYFGLFMDSRAMITDCGSFLLEYAPTKMPIIRPLAASYTLKPSQAAERVFQTYYTVHNWTELEATLNRVVIAEDDYLKEERLTAVRKANLIGHSAGKAVLEILTSIVKG